MATCSHCRERKAKRRCPALGLALCPLCCGMLREKKIHCPASCLFLIRHKPYQEKKVIDREQTFSPDVLQDERLNWLILNIEAPLKEYGERNPSFSDRDAILALAYAKDKVKKSQSALVLPQEEVKMKNEVGEAIFLNLETCHYERKIILPQRLETYEQEEKLKCLENVLATVKHKAKGNLEGRNYLRDLSRRFARIKEASQQRRIISST